MKRILIILFLIFSAGVARTQTVLPAYPDSLFSTYYWQRVTLFSGLPQQTDDIVFIGNSITDGAEWAEIFRNLHMKNRGISGDISAGVIRRLPLTLITSPAKIFLMIGVNDLARNISPDSLLKNLFLITSYIRQQHPSTKLYVQSVLPVNDSFGKFGGHVNKGEQINYVNRELRMRAAGEGYTFIDLHSAFADATGRMKANVTNDGLHLNGSGYLLWQALIYPYVFDLTKKPALIPAPQELQWGNAFFSLADCEAIVVTDASLTREAEKLQEFLNGMGWHIPIKAAATGPSIQLQLKKIDAPQYAEESYSLQADSTKVVLSANTSHGIFNAVQTLKQLSRDAMTVPACAIRDWPAYSWRGYMVDVGRNFMPVQLLKQQIEQMARYKLNIFHFHFTEDIAWRLAIKRYPQLTSASTMLRNPGEFYSEADMKELIAFCADRHVTLVPEIDMPGHSAAFRRAMGVDIQSDSGLAIVKNILKEFFETYDLPIFHIGADEVKITNKDFLPEVIRLIRQYKKQIVGWQPGGNFTDDVIRQLWTGDAGEAVSGKNLKAIDSRHLYLNHMDPLESVTTIFFRQIGDQTKGSANIPGGTLCLWPDRRIATPEDALRTNPVYPGIITFAERTWRGGGLPDWTAVIGEPGSQRANEFREFEHRLISHKKQYFRHLPFPYVPQSSSTWTLYGPYDNKGKTDAVLGPERLGFDTTKLTPLKREVGGTIVLRHWWYPLIHGAIDNPVENSTVYARTDVWSPEAGYKNFWIGFDNLSRSPATHSPPPSAWDAKNGELWVNDTLVAPPNWKRAGMKGDSEIPLIDEGYEYRPPSRIFLKKGWNTVWVKAPVAGFKGSDWQNPVKWQFTFVEVPGD